MTLQDLSDGLVESLKAASSSVVRVAGRRRYALSGTLWNENLIVTTSRAVERDEGVQITFADGDTHPATLLGRDPSTDLAVLKLDAALPAPVWFEGGLEVGQLVLMAGRPTGGVRASLGIIGALGGAWRTALGGRVTQLIEPDARTFPGFSGGPLLSASGEILGVNTAALTRETPVTLPTATVRRVVETLQAHGRMRRGYVGLTGQPVRLPDASGDAAEQRVGLLITSVEADAPAARAGLLIGDILVSFAGAPVGNPMQLSAHLGEETIGQEVTAQLVRGGAPTELTITVSERPR